MPQLHRDGGDAARVIKLRAVTININYRYLAGELAYHLRDGDLSALVHDQDLAEIVDAGGAAENCLA